MTRLTKHFQLSEFIVSDRHPELAARIEQTPQRIANLTRLCCLVLEPLRLNFGAAVRINSGLRSSALNEAIGGSPTTQHVYGEAADIVVEGVPAEQVYTYLRIAALDTTTKDAICQLFWYKKSNFCHVSVPSFVAPKPNRIGGFEK